MEKRSIANGKTEDRIYLDAEDTYIEILEEYYYDPIILKNLLLEVIIFVQIYL